MGKNEDEFQRSICKTPSFTGGCLEIPLFYMCISPCAVDSLPGHLTLYHLRRDSSVFLDINGSRIPSSDAVSITLRRDRVDRDCSDVKYVSTDSVRISGPMEFGVHEEGKDMDLIICGWFHRADATAAWSNGGSLVNDPRGGWNMDCYVANTIVANGRSAFFRPKVGMSPSIEVYVAGCCSRVPVILTKTILVSARRKNLRKGMLDAISENEEMGTEQKILISGSVRQEISHLFTEADTVDYESDWKVMQSYYSEDMYSGDNSELSWFNAGVRVGVGIGLGMCLGVGLLMQSYQAATRSYRRRFF